MNLQIIKEDSRYLWCLCPNHNDVNTANLCVNKTEINNKPKGYGYCYACGYRMDIDPKEVDKMSKLKTISRKPVPTDWYKLNYDYQIQTFVNGKYNELRQEWKVNSLLKYGIGWCGDSHTFPMRNENGAITGILRRFPDGKKLCVHGSQLGLFLPNMQIVQPVVIVEGVSDSAMITELGFWGIGLPSAAFGHEIVRKFLDNQNYSGKVLIIADADEAGKKSAEKMKKSLTFRYDCAIIEPEVGKDVRNFVDIKGKEYVKKWIEENL